jgi:superfamily I DNA/RNA helicase
MLAMERACSFAKAGHRTLFLCYNDLLAEVLREHVPIEIRNTLVVRHFHAWCRECCVRPEARANGISFRVPSDESEQKLFWDSKSADLLLKAIPLVSERYDAVVVDEGQDFASDWWYPIEEALSQSNCGRALYVFYDPDQNLYGRELESPIEGDPFTLDENCRNTKSISRFCKAVIRNTQEPLGSSPEGEEPTIVIGNSAQEQLRELGKILDQLLKSDRLDPSQVALLVAGGITAYSGLKGLEKIGAHKLTTSVDRWKKGEGVFLESSKRFKGLEADVLILAGMAEPGSSEYFTESDLYVSASRGKHRLFLVCRTKNAQNYGEEKIKAARSLLPSDSKDPLSVMS